MIAADVHATLILSTCVHLVFGPFVRTTIVLTVTVPIYFKFVTFSQIYS